MLNNEKEILYVVFHNEDSGLVRKFELNLVVSHIDPIGDQLIIVPYNKTNGLYDGNLVCDTLMSNKYNHAEDERCALWRYLFYTQWPNTRCVRYSKVLYPKEIQDFFGMIAVKDIKEFGI